MPLNWTITQTGNYNGAGMSDILWVDSTGNVATWFMNATTVSSMTGNVGTSWRVRSQGAD